MNKHFRPTVDTSGSDIKLSREVLFHRHRLSHQQIDDLLGDQQHHLVLEEKIDQLRQVALFLEITTALNNAEIWFVAYKGPLLSYRIYNDATCRRCKDFDFLVQPDEVSKTIDVLCKIGFVPRSFHWPVSKFKEKKLLFFINQYTLDHLSDDISIEIHWSLLKFPAIRQKKMSAIIHENIQQTVFEGQNFNQFTLEFELLHLVIHGGLHTWSRLKWLIDIHEIINRFPVDKKKFEILVKQFDAKRLVGLCNAMLSHYFPGTASLPIDSPAPKWFIKYSLHQIGRTTDTPVYLPKDSNTYRWFHILAFPRWRYRLMKVLMLFIFFLQKQKRKFLYINPVRI